MEILDYLQKEDLTDDMQIIADYLGLEQVKILIKHLGGIPFHIPKVNVLHKTIIRYIKENPGKTRKEYAIALSVSDKTVWKCLKELDNLQNSL